MEKESILEQCGKGLEINRFVEPAHAIENSVLNARIDSLKSGDHVCHIFENEEEQYHLITRFFAKGLARGEMCFLVTGENGGNRAVQLLEKFGINTSDTISSGALLISDWNKVYFRDDDRFNPDTLFQSMKKRVDGASKSGYPAVRGIADMAWSLTEKPGCERLMEYESRLNYLIPKIKLTGICQYSMKKFSSEFLINALQTHPIALHKHFKGENRYYMPPEEFLVSESISITGAIANKGIKSKEQIKSQFKKGLGGHKLTKQEHRVIDLLLLCKSNKEIGETLSISVNTVKQHIKNIFRKIGVSRRIELISHFIKEISKDQRD